jgi:unsaturated rhamnogalacturonyl hydrolase
LAFSAPFASCAGAAQEDNFQGKSPLEWSQRLARSEMARRGDTLDFSPRAKAPWNYTSGFFAYSLLELSKADGDSGEGEYGARIVRSCIAGDGSIRGYDQSEFNLDMITPGRAVIGLYQRTMDPSLKKAAMTLRRQLALQPRTYEGGFWHKLIYPDQMWLDGLYMAGPFLAHYGAVFNDREATADVANQIEAVDRHLYDPRTGLYFHAWDARRVQSWADPHTGCSPNFWGRSIGWYAMASVDVLQDLRFGRPESTAVAAIFRKVAEGIRHWQDASTGVWWQVVDQGSRPGNYAEASASSMYVYALAKGINDGWLDRERFGPVAVKGYNGLVTQFIRSDPAGQVSITHCCAVAGLGFKNSAGRSRDGSFEYYVTEPVVENDLKAVSAFILAGLEVQKLTGHGP